MVLALYSLSHSHTLREACTRLGENSEGLPLFACWLLHRGAPPLACHYLVYICLRQQLNSVGLCCCLLNGFVCFQRPIVRGGHYSSSSLPAPRRSLLLIKFVNVLTSLTTCVLLSTDSSTPTYINLLLATHFSAMPSSTAQYLPGVQAKRKFKAVV